MKTFITVSILTALTIFASRDASATCSNYSPSGSCGGEENNVAGIGNYAQTYYDNSTGTFGGVGVEGLSNISIGVLGSTETLGANVGGVGVQGIALEGVAVQGLALSTGVGGTGVYGFSNSSGYGVYGQSISSYGGYFTSPGTGGSPALGGIATSSGGTGVYGTASGSASVGVNGASDSGAGVYGTASSGAGKGISGYASGSSGYGVWGESSSNVGVYGTGPVGTQGASTNGYGVYGGDSSAGYGVYGTAGSNGFGVYGTAGADGYGVYGDSSGSNSVAVYANNTGTGSAYGVYAVSSNSNGVYAQSNGNSAAVKGVSGTTSTSNGAVYAENTGGGYGIYATSSGDAGYFSGNVKITGTLTVVGDINGANGGTCTCSSDERLKKNIEPLPSATALEQMLKLRGVSFEWKNPEEHQNHAGTQTGVIAQDVEKVIPQWVGEDKKGFKTVDPDARTVLALTVESFREVKVENDELKRRLDKQQEEIDRLLHGKDPISQGPGFGAGMLALFAAGFTGATGLALKRLGLSFATVLGLLFAGRKKDDENKA
jgi:hypothetical protein